MPTIKRQIDALGGAPEGSGEYNAGYHDGHTRALEDAMAIGADADALVEDLIEWIEDILEGRKPLVSWAVEASQMVGSLRRQRSL